MTRDQQKQYKELAQAVLRCQGIAYADWLAEQHRTLVLENVSLIASALTKQNHKETEM